MGKQAVVIIIDANVTMDKPYPKQETAIQEADDTGTTEVKESSKPLSPSARLDCAKKTVTDMIANLMIQSKTNEVCVFVLKTPCTKHHKYDQDDYEDQMEEEEDDDTNVPFANITELAGDGTGSLNGMSRASPELLRQIQQIQSVAGSSSSSFSSSTSTTTKNPSQILRGDFSDGIKLGASALLLKTQKKKYDRRIVLITDAEHEVQSDHNELLMAVDCLRDMDCQLQVIGLDFDQSATFSEAVSAETAVKKVKQQEPNNHDDNASDGDDNGSETEISSSEGEDSDDDESDEEDPEERMARIKRGNEILLIGITKLTGGFVAAAHEMQQVLDTALGKRTTKSVQQKFIFQIAPNLVLETVRCSKLIQKAGTPTLKKVVVMENKDNNNNTTTKTTSASWSQSYQSQSQSQLQDPPFQPMINALGEEMTEPFDIELLNFDPENEEREVHDIARAYRYGADLIPIGGHDMGGLKALSPRCLKILGYMESSKVPLHLCVGPPSVISGGNSRRACVAISALARALRRLEQVGIATMVKAKDNDPILVGLFPLASREPPELDMSDKAVPDANEPLHLVVMQLPFRGDVPRLSLPSFDDVDCHNRENEETAKKMQACDSMIDALKLPDDALDYTKIPNPYIRAFHKTVVNRAMDSSCPVVSLRPNVNEEQSQDRGPRQMEDPMATPQSIVEQAQPMMETFRSTFPLVKRKGKDDANGGGKKRKGPATYRDFL